MLKLLYFLPVFVVLVVAAEVVVVVVALAVVLVVVTFEVVVVVTVFYAAPAGSSLAPVGVFLRPFPGTASNRFEFYE